MKKIVAIIMTVIMAFSAFAISASAYDWPTLGRNETIEKGTIIMPGDTINFTGSKGAQIDYYGGSIVAYEAQYTGSSSMGYEYFEDTQLPTGLVVKSIGNDSTGYMLVEGTPQATVAPIDFDIEHSTFAGWKVLDCQNTSSYFSLTLEATWVEDTENPFPEPEVEEPSIIDIIMDYLQQAMTYIMSIGAEVVAYVMDFLGIGPTPIGPTPAE